ncbi:B-box zinc finger protein 32-like [Lolium rigidum]|uniref:B-box zinc finger protein 32-like n=1 Tax=Lolium rigidum TaxID=89674 RepID=UPI001F5CEF5B|nr:B-box zinc finger protein 32-like [Lolium rigidum]
MEAALDGMRCALCGAVAHVHCAADAAFLCAPCDADVHGANFLASRHRRTRVSAPKGSHDDVEDNVSATSSTSCLSTADSATTAAMAPQRGRVTKPRTKRRARGDAVLEVWAKRMGLVAPGAARRVASAAARALQDKAAAPRMPLRVAMAAALWREVTANGSHEATGDALRRLEACAHVPARLVLAVGRAAALDTEEGWGECACA